MKNTLNQLKRSGQFMTGFIIFAAMLLMVIIYPLIITADPLEMVGQGTFFKPGTYVAVTDVVTAGTSVNDSYILNVDMSGGARYKALEKEDREAMIEWLEKFGGVAAGELSTEDSEVELLVAAWNEKYDETNPQKGLIAAKKKYYARLDKALTEMESGQALLIANENEEGVLEKKAEIEEKSYVNVKDVTNQKTFLLGTDNFGRDVLTELVHATKTSLIIGLIAGAVATLIGLFLGLLAGFVGGFVDDLIMFVTNLFTVIPSFIILILISYS